MKNNQLDRGSDVVLVSPRVHTKKVTQGYVALEIEANINGCRFNKNCFCFWKIKKKKKF